MIERLEVCQSDQLASTTDLERSGLTLCSSEVELYAAQPALVRAASQLEHPLDVGGTRGVDWPVWADMEGEVGMLEDCLRREGRGVGASGSIHLVQCAVQSGQCYDAVSAQTEAA